MIRAIRKHGRSRVVAIPKSVLKEFDIKEKDKLKFAVEGNKIVLEVVKND